MIPSFPGPQTRPWGQAISDAIFFISDLHLSRARPQALAQFARLLKAIASQQPAPLYILGDLFEEFWIGIDDRHDANDQVMDLLGDFSQRTGTGPYILPGNRDFYLNEDFARRTGAQLLREPFLLSLGGQQQALLLHGDILCSQDVVYQRYRRVITSRWARHTFMALPLAVRRTIARRARSALKKHASNKPPAITDVDSNTVHREMHRHSVRLLIHGHTHRPMIHHFSLAGQPAQRIVLGDWYRGDSVLVWQNGAGRLLTVDQCLARWHDA